MSSSKEQNNETSIKRAPAEHQRFKIVLVQYIKYNTSSYGNKRHSERQNSRKKKKTKHD